MTFEYLLAMDPRTSDWLCAAPVSRKAMVKNSTHLKATMVIPPFRAAAAPQQNLPHQRTQVTRSVAALLLCAALRLSSGRFAVVAPCLCTVLDGIMKVPLQSTR